MTTPTGWDNGLNQDYCRELGRWFADRLGSRQQLREMFMKETITIPRETFDLMREALETCTDGDHSTGHVIAPSFDRQLIDAALSAAKAVSADQAIAAMIETSQELGLYDEAKAVSEPKVKLIPTAEDMGTPVQPQAQVEAKCSQHPKAPHGFDRSRSHTAGRYVCECEGWVCDEHTRASSV